MRLLPFTAVVGLAGLGALGGACSLTTSLSDLTGGATTDAGRNDGDATALTDSGNAIDGAAGVVPFRCSDRPGALFCSDFETDPFNFGWDKPLQDNGTFGLVPARTSRGLSGTVESRTAATQSFAAGLVKTVTMTPLTPFTFSFDVLLGSSLDTANVVDFGGFALRGDTFYQTDLRFSNGTFTLQEFADANASFPALNKATDLTYGPPAGSWAHVELRWTFPAGSSHAVVKIDGATVLDLDTVAHRYPASPQIMVGITNAPGKGSAFKIVVDDVLVTTP